MIIDERKQFFSLPKDLMDIATSLRTPDTQIGFVLVCGYFRAARRFYLPHDFHTRDIQAAATMLDLVVSDFSPDRYAKQTRTRHQQLVMEFHGFAPFDGKAEAALVTEITTMTRTHLKPRLIFDRCADFLTQGRVQVPRSGTLLELIRSGMQAHKVELIALMDAHLTDETRGLLDDLFTAPEEQNRHRLCRSSVFPHAR